MVDFSFRGNISSGGVGSGLDVNTLVDSLVEAERIPRESVIVRDEARVSANLTAIGTLQGALSSFNSSLLTLNTLSTYQQRSISSNDTTVLTATVDETAAPAEHTVQVSQLAKAHSIRSADYTATTDTIGTGKITFQYGSDNSPFSINGEYATQEVTIASSNQSLVGIRDAVNAADIDVQASIINDGTNNILVFTSKHLGDDGTLKVTIDDDDGNDTDNAGLSEIAYDPDGSAGSGKNMSQTVAGQDAVVIIDGISLNKTSNTIDDVIEGVTLDLVKADAGVDKLVTVSLNKTAVENSINDFVINYNGMVDIFNELTKFDPDNDDVGLLLGDATMRGVESQINTIISSIVDGLSTNGNIVALADIGITTTSTGNMTVDSSELSSAVDTKFDLIASLFAPNGIPTDPLVEFQTVTDDTVANNYAVNITTIATQGTLVGTSAVGTLTIDSSNDFLEMSINNLTASIQLPQRTYASYAELAGEIQSQINGEPTFAQEGIEVEVTQSSGTLTFTSTKYGSSSIIDIVGGDGESNIIGAGGGTKTDGVDVAGTFDGAAGIGSGQTLTGVGDAKGLEVKVVGGSTGDRGAINVTRGIADQLRLLITGLLDEEGVIEERLTNGRNNLDQLEEDRIDLEEYLVTVERRYFNQFTTLDRILAAFSRTESVVTSGLENLPGWDN